MLVQAHERRSSYWRIFKALLFVVGTSSSNSTQISSVYSWSFVVKHGAPYLMHSEPLDPQSITLRSHQDPPIHERRSSHWRIFKALLFATADGAFRLLL